MTQLTKLQTAERRRHSSFSLARISAIATNTLTELTRTKVFYFLFVFGLVLLGGSVLSTNFSFGEEFQMLKDVALGAIGIFTTLLSILATSMLLPRDIEDRTLYTILAKPVPRYEYLLGKLAGVFLLLLISTAVMAVLFFALLAHRQGVRLAELTGAFENPADFEMAANQIKSAAFGPSLVAGLLLIFLRACICACFTLLISTFATSALFTIVISFTVYLVGHIQAIARQSWMAEGTANVFQKIFMGIISIVFPDLQMFNLVDDVVAGRDLPGALMFQLVGLAVMYCGIYIIAMLALFQTKEL